MKAMPVPGWVAFLVALAAVSCSTPERHADRLRDRTTDAGSILLFNGVNLRGWTAVADDPAADPAAVWSVREGMIVCRGEPLGYLQSKRRFTDFRMEVEYRWAPGGTPGNSGLFSRIDGTPRALPRCIEVQLMPGNAGDVLGLQGRRIAAEQPRHFHVAAHPVAGDIDGVRKVQAAEREAGVWNQVIIEAQGPTYVVWLNGVEVNRVTGAEVLPGPVGLQSEGGEIHFRKLRLEPR